MTHISGELEWWNATYESHTYKSNELFLYLCDGSMRKMNDWGDSTIKTSENFLRLNIKKGDAIKAATWGGYKITEWFCDVERV